MYKYYPEKRYKHTFDLMRQFVDKENVILDLGVSNPFSKILKKEGYQVNNTIGEDLDLNPEILKDYKADIVTAFEILEHLVNPMGVLKNLPANKLLATVPLRLWFSGAYRNIKDSRDWHYHEFEDWQFDMLLGKSGWEIKHREKWTNPVSSIGIRPLLRKITPRYYAIYAEKK